MQKFPVRTETGLGEDHMAKKKVLLGVDNGSFILNMNFFSNTEKFAVTIVHDREEALRHMREEQPDLAIFDIEHEGSWGVACCQEIRESCLSPATRIAIAVRAAMIRDIDRCLDAQCDAILLKPFEYQRLAMVVTTLLFCSGPIARRFEVRLPVHYGIQPHLLTENYSADLSIGGMFLESERIVPVGTSLNVVLTLPGDGTTIVCSAEVAWLNGPILRSQPRLPTGMGLKFVDIGTREMTAIRDFLYSEERLRWT
jgi:CheY-like chemotaxis protein